MYNIDDDLAVVVAYDKWLDVQLRIRTKQIEQQMIEYLDKQHEAKQLGAQEHKLLREVVQEPPDVAASILDYLEACLPAKYPPHMAPAAAYWQGLLAMMRELTSVKREVTHQ